MFLFVMALAGTFLYFLPFENCCYYRFVYFTSFGSRTIFLHAYEPIFFFFLRKEFQCVRRSATAFRSSGRALFLTFFRYTVIGSPPDLHPSLVAKVVLWQAFGDHVGGQLDAKGNARYRLQPLFRRRQPPLV